jgi:hypothetical protein
MPSSLLSRHAAHAKVLRFGLDSMSKDIQMYVIIMDIAILKENQTLQFAKSEPLVLTEKTYIQNIAKQFF